MAENKEAWLLWSLVNTQWRVGIQGLIGLDYSSVLAVADVYGIEMTPALMRKVKALETKVVSKKVSID